MPEQSHLARFISCDSSVLEYYTVTTYSMLPRAQFCPVYSFAIAQRVMGLQSFFQEILQLVIHKIGPACDKILAGEIRIGSAESFKTCVSEFYRGRVSAWK